MKYIRPFSLIPIVVLLGTAVGCDTSFEAFEETERAYSVFGYLDANADTQYVRVEPIQDSTFAGSRALNARVTSTNVETGKTVVWEKRAYQVGVNSVTVRNAVTATDFQPEATYRFTVDRKRDGATTSAEVTLPPAFPMPTFANAPDQREDSEDPEGPTKIVVRGVERLGAVRAHFDFEACLPMRGCRRRQRSTYHVTDTTHRSDGAIEVEIDWREEIPQEVGATLGRFYSFSVTVAAVSEDWPDYAEDNPPGGGPEGQPLPPPGTESNVENGAGFLGGIFTRTVELPIRRDAATP